MKSSIELHETWGNDSLSAFQHLATLNQLSVHAENKEHIQMMAELDTLMFECMEKITTKTDSNENVGLVLFISSHNHYRASASLIQSGQILPAFPTMRACLETAVYGWYLSRHSKHVKQWINKPSIDNRDELSKWNNLFKFSNIAREIGKENTLLQKSLNQLHQITIDYGANPNKRGIQASLTPASDVEQELYTFRYIHSEGRAVNFASYILFCVALSYLSMISQSQSEVELIENFHNKYDELARRATSFKQT